MGKAIPGLSGVLGGVLQSVYLPMRSKAFPINSPLLQQLATSDGTGVFPTQIYFDERKTASAPCHCGKCPTSRDFNRDVYTVKQTALCWLDEQIERVRERGRQWLSGRHGVEVDGMTFAAKSKPQSKYPPPVSDGIPVRYLPNGDALYAYDQMPEQQQAATALIRSAFGY